MLPCHRADAISFRGMGYSYACVCCDELYIPLHILMATRGNPYKGYPEEWLPT